MIAPLTFTIPALGDFSAKHRTMGTQLKIEQAYRQALGGTEEEAPESLRLVASVQAQLSVLLEQCPAGFLLDDAHINDCYAIYAGLRDAEDRFRDGVAQARQVGGASA